ncbi:hypothetical protein OG21DRAFT_379494 [Imleria badia]|nr:hypothetical protein OG21DRAFT_379494 [Imleria badia]
MENWLEKNSDSKLCLCPGQGILVDWQQSHHFHQMQGSGSPQHVFKCSHTRAKSCFFFVFSHPSIPPEQSSRDGQDEDIPSVTVRREELFCERLLHDDSLTASTRSNCTLRYWCYGLHIFLVAIHVVLVGMLFTHPEHCFSVSINNTTATIALKVFLQMFYTIYTAVLVFIVQRLAISAAMAKRQKLTAIHDICGAWNGIGAVINTLWQQTKVVSSPSTILLILTYLSCISGLHIISSSVIQFEAFNNTITSVVPSTLAWPLSSINLTNIDWTSISPLIALWPLLPTAKGLSGNMLYDVPDTDYAFTGAVVNTTTISAECGLLSNTSVGYWYSGTYFVNISGLGEVGLPVLGPNMVSFINLNSPSPSSESQSNSAPSGSQSNSGIELPCPLCNNYITFQISTASGIDLGNLSSQVFQVDLDIPLNTPGTDTTVPTTLFFVACTLNATNTTQYLPMQNGQMVSNTEPSFRETSSWKMWLPGSTTELTQTLNAAEQALNVVYLDCIQPSPGNQQCEPLTPANMYMNNLLGIPWLVGPSATVTALPLPMILDPIQIEDAVAKMAAAFIWLASTFDIGEGIQPTQGNSSITSFVIEMRMNVNTIPVAFGLFVSIMLLATMAWSLHDSYSRVSKTAIRSPSILELMWISAHSTTLQDFMTRMSNSMSDHLRIEGMKMELCLLNENIGLAECSNEDIIFNSSSTSQSPDCKHCIAEEQSSMHVWCHVLHGILSALHAVLLLLLIYHPEHNITISVYNTWATTLNVGLQAFYV